MPSFEPITKHISRLEMTWAVINFVNIPVAVWLVHKGGQFILVDSGPPENADQLVSAISEATGGRGINQVLLTHAHYDHRGGLDALRIAWNPEVICHQDEAPLLEGEMDYLDLDAGSISFFIGRYLMAPIVQGVSVTQRLQAGQSAAGMAVIHLPGHTPGQIGFLHPEDQAMICGDACMNIRGKIAAPFAPFTSDPNLARASMHRLAELDYLHLLPTHGPPILDDGRARLHEFLGLRLSSN